jgi:general secretion pathway protein D
MTNRLLITLTLLCLLVPSLASGQQKKKDKEEEDAVVQAEKDKARDRVRSLASPRPTLAPSPGGATAAPPTSATAGTPSTAAGTAGDPAEPSPLTDEPWLGDVDTSVATGEPEAPTRPPIQPLPKDVQINIDYDNVDMKDVIKDFSRKTGRNFLIDPKTSGKITIHAPLAVSMEDAYEVFLAILDANGYATVVEARYKSSDDAYRELGYSEPRWRKGDPLITRILPAADARQEPLRLYKGSHTPGTSALITRLIKLDNISAEEVSGVVGKWVSGAGEMVAYAPTNMLILTDSANNITRIMELIKELDISAPRQKLEVVTIQFAEATRVVEIIKEIYGEDGTAQSKTKTTTPRRTSTARSKSAKAAAAKKSGSTSKVGSSTSFIGKMIADERTNSIIVLATEKSLVEIRELIARIDYETDPFADGDIHVMYLEHAKAEELSQTLNNLIQQSNQRAQQRQSERRGSGASGASGTAASRRQERQAAARSGRPGDGGGNFEGEVRLTHDVPTNSLVVTASREDYSRLRKVVDMLDIPRKQVFVETVIMEVSDTRINDNGVSWHGGGLISGDATSASIIAARGQGSISPAAGLLDGSLLAGLGMGIFGEALNIPLPGVDGGLEIPAFGVIMRFLQEDQSTNVLSSPNILTLDNEEATIEIGETVPFPSGGLGSLAGLAGAAGGAAGGLLSSLPSISFTREDVGIILRITPQINESDWVTMEVYQEISEVKEGSAGDSASSGGPTTTKRSAETTISVQSNQTIVIGGLMQEVETESESKIPILGDIPLLGALFRNKRKTKRKTNLLIFLTPHVIDGPEDLQEVYRIKMLQRQEFMKRFYGKTPDEQLAELNELVRYSMNLPDSPSVYRDRPPKPREVMLRFDQPLEEEVDPSDDELYDALDDYEGDGILITPGGEASYDEAAAADDEAEAGDAGEETDDPEAADPEAVEPEAVEPETDSGETDSDATDPAEGSD